MNRPSSSDDPQPVPGSLKGRNILVCVCGGISAYKTAALVSRLVQADCGVTVAMTRNARKFIGATTFEALSGKPVAESLWRTREAGHVPHLSLVESAELVVVAPATANILGKLAAGLADDLVSALLLGAACPVLLAPAMNAQMWQHPAVQRNIGLLRDDGYLLVGPDEGWQACRAVGPGRMSEPDAIFEQIREQLCAAR